MSPREYRQTGLIALIFALRMLGLFMVLPILSQYAKSLPGATAITIGWAFGAYGLTQALLQIPLGLYSDRFGRKPIITIGLLLFLLGSVIAAKASTMMGIIAGRAVQGAGAIGSTLLALLADITDESHRTKAMAIVGLSIGFAFMLALFIGPGLAFYFGLSGLFWCMAGFAVLALMVLHGLIKQPSTVFHHLDIQTTLSQAWPLLKDPHLTRLYFSIFSLHAILTALFMVIPQQIAALGYHHGNAALQVYLPTLLIASIVMLPLVIVAERKQQMKCLFLASIVILMLSISLLWRGYAHVLSLVAILACFFTAFNLLEATLPSWISKMAPIRGKGTAIGIYSTCQFLGIFLGGALGGWSLSLGGTGGIYMMCLSLSALWLLIAFPLPSPQYLQTLIVKTATITEQQANKLTQNLLLLSGVADVVISTDEAVAYLKIDRKHADREQIQQLVNTYS